MINIPRPFPWIATLCTIAGVVVLCALGNWQLDRLLWKNTLQASLDQEFSLTQEQLPLLTSNDLSDLKGATLKRGVLKGQFDFSHQIALQGQVIDGKSVSYQLVPLVLEDKNTIFVVAGYQPGADELAPPLTRARIDKVIGSAKLPEWNRFTPPNDPARNMWFRPDTKEMASTLGLSNVLPPLFYAEWTGYKFDALPSVQVQRKLRNDHQSYAYFWYTMAFVLAAIYLIRFWRNKPQAS